MNDITLFLFNRTKFAALTSRWKLWNLFVTFIGGGGEWYSFICPSDKNRDWLDVYNSNDRYQP